MFNEGRDDIGPLIMRELTPTRNTIASRIGGKNMCDWITCCLPHISERALGDAKCARAFYLGLVGCSSPIIPPGIGLHRVKDNDALLVTSQQSVMLDHMERVMRMIDMQLFVKACAFLTGLMSGFEVLDLASSLSDAPDKVEGAMCKNGWCLQVWIDLVCVFAMSEVGASMQTGVKMESEMQTLVKAVTDNQTKISGRIRCYHNHINGANHPAKKVWATMEGVYNDKVHSDLKEHIDRQGGSSTPNGDFIGDSNTQVVQPATKKRRSFSRSNKTAKVFAEG